MRYVVILLALFTVPLPGNAQLSTPENLGIRFSEHARKVQLIWDKVENATGYNIFVRRENDANFTLLGEAGMLYKNSFQYSIKSEFGHILEFAVCSVVNYPIVVRSELSDPIAIEVPSTRLPMVKLNQPKVRSNAVSVSWEYQHEISDLKAFVVLVNGNPKPVTGSQQKVVLENMPRGNYAIEVQAQTKSGVKSPPSTRRFVTVK